MVIQKVDSQSTSDRQPRIGSDQPENHKKLSNGFYEKELARLQIGLVKLQEWVKRKKLKVVVLFEGSCFSPIGFYSGKNKTFAVEN